MGAVRAADQPSTEPNKHPNKIERIRSWHFRKMINDSLRDLESNMGVLEAFIWGRLEPQKLDKGPVEVGQISPIDDSFPTVYNSIPDRLSEMNNRISDCIERLEAAIF